MNEVDNKKNILYGFIYQVLYIVCGFLLRRVLLAKAGIYLIGVNAVFENIISMIDLIDFGISSSSMYYLYDAFSHKDYNKVSVYFQSLKKLYRRIALTILTIGIIILLNISFFVDIDPSVTPFYVKALFLIHLLRAVAFYLLTSYKWALQCDGKRFYSYQSDIIALLIFFIIRYIFLQINGDIIIYLLLQLIEMILSNIYIISCFNKEYNMVDFKNNHGLKEAQSNILEYAKSLAINNINNFINNCTDNLVISKICGTVIVGFMSNYYLIMDSVRLVFQQFFSSIEANIYKRIYASKNNNDVKNIYNETMLISFTISSFSSVFLMGLTNLFISLYFGPDYSIGNSIPLLMCINIAIILMQYPSKYILTVNGLLKQIIPVSTIMVIINICLSIILTIQIGAKGALIGTVLANIIYSIGQDYIIIKNLTLFNNKIILKKILYYILILIQILIIYYNIPLDCSITSLVYTFVICLTVFVIFELPWFKKIILIFKSN